MELSANLKNQLAEALDQSGMRPTRQREHVFSVILEHQDHPTADEIYARTRETSPSISLATVYNCLEALIDCGLVRQVNLDREPTRYCPHLHEHAHFRCEQTGRIEDVELPTGFMSKLLSQLPEGYEADRVDIYIHGRSAPDTGDREAEVNAMQGTALEGMATKGSAAVSAQSRQTIETKTPTR